MSTSDFIQIATLVVISLYTYFTYQLFSHQRDQFRLSVRPWIYPGDIHYEYKPNDCKLAILLYNFGKLPALAKITVEKILIKPLLAEEIQIKQVEREKELSIFPHVSGVDSVFMFFIHLFPKQSLFLIDGSRLDILLEIQYRTLTENGEDFPYSYSAILTVENFKENIGKQSTLIKNVIAK